MTEMWNAIENTGSREEQIKERTNDLKEWNIEIIVRRREERF